MRALSQLDPAWASKNIGKTSFKIGRWGCTITSIAMIRSKFFGEEFNPDYAAQKFSFNSEAKILWSQSDFEGLKFFRRGYGFDEAAITEAANSGSWAVILEVNRSHWVAVEHAKDGKIAIIDPLHAVRYEDVTEKYTVTGFALFQVDPEWAKQQELTDLEWCKQHLPEVGWDEVVKTAAWAPTSHRALANRVKEWKK